MITYQIAAYRLHGGVVIYFAGFQRHYSVYPRAQAKRAAPKKR